MVSTCDFIGYGGDFLAVEGLSHIDKKFCLVLAYHLVEFGHIADTDNVVETQIFVERLFDFLEIRGGRGDGVVGGVERIEHKTVFVGHQVEDIDIAGRKREFAVQRIEHAVEFVENRIKRTERFEEFHFVFEALFFEQLENMAGEPFAAHEWEILRDDLTHISEKTFHQFGRTLHSRQPAVITIAHRVGDS